MDEKDCPASGKETESANETSAADGITIVDAPEGLDVENIMAEVRRLVAEKRPTKIYEEPAGSPARSTFGAEWVTTVGEQVDLLRAAARLDVQGEPITSHRRYTGRFIVAWKKFVRFWVRKYTDAIFLRQSFFNSQVVGALEQLEQRIETLEDEVNTLRAQVKELSKQLSAEKSGQEKKNRP